MRILRFSIGVACIGAAALLAWCASKSLKPFTAEDVSSGRCASCIFESVEFRSDSIVVTGAYSQRVLVAGQLDEILFADFSSDEDAGVRVALLDLAYFAGGETQRVAPVALAGLNAVCAVRGKDSACAKAKESMGLRFDGPGVATARVRTVITRSMPGGIRAWRRIVPQEMFAPRYELLLTGNEGLATEGDLEPIGNGTWRFRDRGKGFAIASSGTWNAVMAAYQAHERRAIETSAPALAAVPRAPDDASIEDVIQSHWLWIRRNLEYRRNHNAVNGEVAPSSVAETMKRGWGDCKDFVLLMAALLSRDGIASESVLVDTDPREGEPYSLWATPRVNHVVLYVPDIDAYLDPTLAPRTPLATGGGEAYEFVVRFGRPPMRVSPEKTGEIGDWRVSGEQYAPPPVERVGAIPYPIDRDDLLGHLHLAVRGECLKTAVLEAAGIETEACLNRIERVAPICKGESASLLPPIIESSESNQAAVRAYVECLYPPIR